MMRHFTYIGEYEESTFYLGMQKKVEEKQWEYKKIVWVWLDGDPV